MAQLVLAVARAAVTAAFPGIGGTLAGFAVSSLGSLFAPAVKGSRLADLKAPQAAYGAVVPYVEAVMRVPGVYVWQSAKKEIKKKQRSGKGGAQSVTYSYRMDCLIMLAENELVGVRRIFDGGKLISTATNTASASSLNASGKTKAWSAIRFYNGNAAQLPDPIYEAAVGVGNAPAYRGRSCIFIENLNLYSSGQIPNLTFEVVRAGSFADFGRSGTGYWSATNKGTDLSLSNFNRTVTKTGGTNGSNQSFVRCEVSSDSGKGYFELSIDQYSPNGITGSTSSPQVALMTLARAVAYQTTSGSFMSDATNQVAGMSKSGQVRVQSTTYSQTSVPVTARICVAIDIDAQKIWFGTAGVWSGDPATGTGGYSCPGLAGRLYIGYFAWNLTDLPDVATLSIKASEMAHTIPAGFVAWDALAAGNTLTPTNTFLDAAIQRQFERAGLNPATDLDVTAVADVQVRGFALSQLESPRNTLERLMSAYAVEAVESGGKIKFFKRGASSVVTIPYGSLGAAEGAAASEPLPLVRSSDLELPSHAVVKFANSLNDFQDGSESSDKLISSNVSPEVIELALAMTPAEAKKIADIRIADIAASVIRVNGLQIGKEYSAIEPGDVLTVIDADGSAFRVRAQRIEDSTVRKLDALLDDATIVTSVVATDESQVGSDVVTTPANTVLSLLDVPIFRDADDSSGFYAAVAKSPTTGDWGGAVLFQGLNDAAYGDVADFSEFTFVGSATTALANFTGIGFDETNTVTVTGSGTLDSYTEDAVFNGSAPYLVIGSEVVFYLTATQISAGTYTLRRLLRGRRGTEFAMGSHAIGEAVTLVQTDGLQRIALSLTQIGASLDYRAVTSGTQLDAATRVPFTCRDVGKRPFAPVALELDSPTSPANLSWKRRTRLATRFCGSGGILVPLGESTEQYVVEVTDSSDVVLSSQTVTTSTAAVTFSATNKLKVYQLSATYGRGTPAVITV